MAGGFCSCVLYARALTGFNQTVGAAKNWPVNSPAPLAGGVVVMRWANVGHVAVITDVTNADFGIKEANYARCQLTARRITLNDPDIIGFWAP